MNKIFKDKYLLKIILGVIILVYIFSLIGRSPHVDDAWLGEHAYWLAETGQAKSELMRGITNQEDKIVVHHKFHTYLGAGIIKIFGFSLSALKSISLISFIIFLLVFYGFTYKKLFSGREFIFAVSLLLANALIFNLSFVFRPEILVMTLGFISYIFLQSPDNKHKRYLPVALAGLFAGLAVSTHLNGLIFPVAGFVLLIWNKRIKESAVFAISTLPTIGIYFLDMTTLADFNLWYHQISDSPSVEALNQSTLAMQFLMRIVDEQMRFMHSPREIVFTVLFLLTFIPAYRYMKQHRNLLRYTLLLVVALMLISVNKSSKYIILYMPYLVMIITLSIRYILNHQSSRLILPKSYGGQKLIRFISIVVFGYFAIQMVYNFDVAIEKHNENDTRMITREFIGLQTDTLNIIAPMTSVFNEIEHFNRIQGEICYNELKKSDPSIYKAGFLKKAEEFDIDYIILSEFFIVHFGVDQLEEDDLLASRYEMVHKSNDMVILRNHN